jgi:hypothetical protein
LVLGHGGIAMSRGDARLPDFVAHDVAIRGGWYDCLRKAAWIVLMDQATQSLPTKIAGRSQSGRAQVLNCLHDDGGVGRRRCATPRRCTEEKRLAKPVAWPHDPGQVRGEPKRAPPRGGPCRQCAAWGKFMLAIIERC